MIPRHLLGTALIPDTDVQLQLYQSGFDVREHTVRPHRAGKGPRHHIWIGT